MHHGKWPVWALTIALLAVVLLCFRLAPQPQTQPRERDSLFSVEVGRTGEEVRVWKDPDGNGYLFLPDYARQEQLKLRLQPGEQLQLAGQPQSDGAVLTLTEEPIPFFWDDGQGQTLSSSLCVLYTGGIPVLHVDVRSGNMDYIHEMKGNAEPGRLRLYQPEGTCVLDAVLESVKGRGNATWEQEKKPYTLKLRQEASLLEMGAAQTWILLPNCLDPTNLRNQMIYGLAGDVGMAYTPRSQWVDLYLNGEYAGLYLLCEKVEVQSRRLDIPADTGFLVSREKTDRVRQQDLEHVTTSGGVYLRIHHSQGDKARIQKLFQTLERALESPDGVDPETGASWESLVDLDSWAEKYLIEEISGNLDAGAISQFFYSDGSGRIFAGPVWDYDMSLGNSRTWQIDTPNMLYAGRPHLWSDSDSSWYALLYRQDAFRQRLEALYAERFRPALENMIDGRMATYAELTEQSARLNAVRWSQEEPARAIEAMESYMRSRMAFLDSLWLEHKDYHTVELWIREHVVACYAVEPGGTIPFREVPYGTETILYEGWYNAQDDTLFDFYAPVDRDTFVYLKQTDLNEQVMGVTVSGGLSAVIRYVPSAAGLMLLAAVLTVEALRRKGDPQRKGEREKVI